MEIRQLEIQRDVVTNVKDIESWGKIPCATSSVVNKTIAFETLELSVCVLEWQWEGHVDAHEHVNILTLLNFHFGISVFNSIQFNFTAATCSAAAVAVVAYVLESFASLEKSVYVLCFISSMCIIAHWFIDTSMHRCTQRDTHMRQRVRLTFTDKKNKSNSNGTGNSTPKPLVSHSFVLTGIGGERERPTDCVIANVYSTLIFPLSGYF